MTTVALCFENSCYDNGYHDNGYHDNGYHDYPSHRYSDFPAALKLTNRVTLLRRQRKWD